MGTLYLSVELTVDILTCIVGLILVLKAKDNRPKFYWGCITFLIGLVFSWENIEWLIIVSKEPEYRFTEILNVEKMLKWYPLASIVALFPLASLFPGYLNPFKTLAFLLPMLLLTTVGICYICFNGYMTPLASYEDVLNSLPISDGCIYFFDDGAYSGGQVISIFQELMDIPLQERIISESHVTGLSEENKIKLKKCNIGLMYLVFNKQIEDKIKDELKKLGIEKVNIAFLHDMSEKIFDEGTSNSLEPEDKEVLKKYLNDIGYELLNSAKKQKNGEYKTNWDEERVRSSALGYEDAQQLVVFNYNIPTYSITAFWANGYFKGHEWKGLFQRTVND